MRRFLVVPALIFLAAPACSSSGGSSAGGSDAGRDSAPDAMSVADAHADSATDAAHGDAAASDAAASDAAIADATSDAALDAAPTGPAYYVATTGDDHNPGTLTSPWRTLQHAINTIPAGATAYARAGVYAESVTVSQSGTSGKPITLASYPGETAIVDGTSVPVVDGAGLIDINGQSWVTIQGLEIRNWTSTTSAVPAGIMIQGASTNISILGNHIHDIVTTVESCNGAGGNAFGLAAYGNATAPISGLLIHGNELNQLRTGCSESMTINGNVDGFEVSQNLVHDNDNIGIDAIGGEGTGPTAALDQARNGAIRQNTVYNINSQGNAAYNGLGADGIYVDGGANLVIEQNLVHNVDLGIELASEHSGHTASYVVARNNLVYYSNSSGISIGGYSASVGGTDHCALLGNTLYANATELTMQFHVTNVLYENNLVYDSAGNFQSGATTGTSIDHDLQLQTGAATVFVNPGTPTNGAIAVDLHVASGTLSQVQGKGIIVACPSGWTCPANWGTQAIGAVDFAGNPRTASGAVDIGAYAQ